VKLSGEPGVSPREQIDIQPTLMYVYAVSNRGKHPVESVGHAKPVKSLFRIEFITSGAERRSAPNQHALESR
jgi:hypothetical protein